MKFLINMVTLGQLVVKKKIKAIRMTRDLSILLQISTDLETYVYLSAKVVTNKVATNTYRDTYLTILNSPHAYCALIASFDSLHAIVSNPINITKMTYRDNTSECVLCCTRKPKSLIVRYRDPFKGMTTSSSMGPNNSMLTEMIAVQDKPRILLSLLRIQSRN